MADASIRTSLEVGFAEGTLPRKFEAYRGRAMRAIPIMDVFPFEDAQFDVVMMHGDAVNFEYAKEAHRVLRTNGRLFFIVNERTRKQEGFTLPDLYTILRDGFNLTQVERPAWWLFGRQGRTLTICATKKAWKTYKGFVRDGSLPFAPFRERS